MRHRASALLLGLLVLMATPAAPAHATRGTPTSPAPAASGAANTALTAAGRWIVVLKPDGDLAAATGRAKAMGIKPDRTFRDALRGFSAKLSDGQLAAVRADPAVDSVVPDAIVSIEAQKVPNGVRRVNGPKSPIARINGIDERVDADVAIVDTGIDPAHPDLNVAGGVNCSTSDRNAWQDDNGHGTHVAGTVGALDNGFGVVGVAPGVRLWAVRILNSDGNGLLSWYVCGLDWITGKRDPVDSSLPFFEAVNMSVAKTGSDDANCGLTNQDVLHQAICRLVQSGVTVVAAAGNNSFNANKLVPASYNEVITVSALADTDGKPGGLGGNSCYSWGTYDRDDTFADFSNYGADVDLIAPGKCIWSTRPGNTYGYSSGTSMAAPHVTGAVALYKASRPLATPAQVKSALQTLGTLNWLTSTDPDGTHERLLDVSRIVPLGDFAIDATSPSTLVSAAGATVSVPIAVVRAEDFSDEVSLSAKVPTGFSASFVPALLSGQTATRSTMSVIVPKGLPTGGYPVVVSGENGDRTRTASVSIKVDGDLPVLGAPRLGVTLDSRFDTTVVSGRGYWGAAKDATSAIAGCQAQWSIDGGAWGGTTFASGGLLHTPARWFTVGRRYQLRVRAKDTAGNWSAWATAPAFTALVTQNTSRRLSWHGTWHTSTSSTASGGSTRYATSKGASVWRSFTGRAVAVVAPRSRTRGKAQVWVDGVLASTIDLYHSTSLARRVVFSRVWTARATHVIKLVVLGTTGRPRVDLDALVVVY